MIAVRMLLAQAIGRWGNFFNHEVYGMEVAIADGWWWLPTFIQKEMGVGLAEGHIYVPLFLIEGMINLAGYFLIAYLVPAIWKKFRAPGVLAGVYLIFYGAARMILEPFRSASYNMGTNGQWSFWNALGYIVIGLLLIAWLEVYEYAIRKKWEARKLARAEIKAANNPIEEDLPSEGDEASLTEEPELAEEPEETSEALDEEAKDDDEGEFFIVRKKDHDK